MINTYAEAMNHVLEYEGGYSNDRGDPGGPTNWGITIHDARMYWKPNATAANVRAMPKSVALDIYRKHYADPLRYDYLPAGLDFAVLDYGINSGISRAAKVLQNLLGVTPDGQIGPITVGAAQKADVTTIINGICDERLHFLQHLHTWPIFGKGWGSRVKDARKAALQMATKPSPTGV